MTTCAVALACFVQYTETSLLETSCQAKKINILNIFFFNLKMWSNWSWLSVNAQQTDLKFSIGRRKEKNSLSEETATVWITLFFFFTMQKLQLYQNV